MIGIEAYGGITNLIIRDCYIHDCKTYGIQVYGTTIQVRGNHVLNSNANGICNYLGSGYVIEGNLVNGASDNGISISSPDCVVAHNVIQNVNLGVSPFGANAGVGIYVGDLASSYRVSVRGNIVDTCAGNGLYVGNCTDVTFEGNLLYTTEGIYVGRTAGALVKGNTIDGCSDSSFSGYFIELTGTCPDLIFEGNYIANFPTSAYGIVIQTDTPAIIKGNMLILSSGSYSAPGILVNGSNYCTISGNIIDMSNVTGGSGKYGIFLNGSNLLFEGNTLIGIGWNSYAGNSFWYAIADNSANSLISNNNIISLGTSPIPSVAILSVGTRYIGNIGGVWNSTTGSFVNPFGQIPNPFDNGHHTITPGYWGSSGVNATSPSASTTYSVNGSDMIINATGGTGVSITIRDPYGNAVLSGASTLTAQRLPFGYTINFGPFTTAPTVTVFGE